MCKQDKIKMGDVASIEWEYASIGICAIDAMIMLIISFAIISLRSYEKASNEDLKQGRLRIEDFSVIIPTIPIEADDYSNSPALLKAMMALHLEDICAGEMQ